MIQALKNRILVKSYQHQKNKLSIKGEKGKIIDLHIGFQYRENHREKNPVVAEVIDNNSSYKYLKKGDLVLVHHNLVDSPATNQYCIEYDPETGMGLYSLPAGRNFFCKINKKTGKALPVCNNLVVERMANPIVSKYIIIPETVKQEHDDMVKILSISPEVKDLEKGMVVAILEKADYEIVYTFNKKEHHVIKVYYDDVQAVFN